MSTVIVVPSQSEHSKMFLGVAKKVKATCYGGKAAIYQTVVAVNGSITFKPEKTDGEAFTKAVDSASTFLILCHSGENDGPRLTGDMDGDWSQMNHYQPWWCDDTTHRLGENGKNFWRSIGRKKKKIILGGCKTGHTYAQAVSEVSGPSTVYGFKHKVAAADSATMIGHVSRIEKTGHSSDVVAV